MKKTFTFLLLMALLVPWAAQAQTKTHIATTSTSTQMTWAEFAQNVNNGITYEGETVYLDADITATTRAGYETGYGTSSHVIKSFQGSFDGQGHTITFNYTADNTYAAPFAYVKNATFLNLKTAGTITANTKRYAGGIAGMVISGSQNCTFTNCESNVTITSTSNGTNDCRHGGFVANVVGGNVTFNGCAFTGGFSGTNAYGWGGFVGFFNHYVYFTDCIFSPTSISIYNQNNYTFACPSGTQVITFTNCYYTQSLDGSQGKQRYTVTAEPPLTIAMSGTATDYNVSHITAYSDNPGLVYNGTLIAGEGDNVSLNLGGAFSYNADHGTLTGSANPYTLGMAAYNTTISAIIQPASFPYSTDFEDACDWVLVNGSCTNQWWWGTATNNGGTHSLYISNDGGAHNTNSRDDDIVFTYKTFNFEARPYIFSYDWRAFGGERASLRVALAPATETLEAGTRIEGLNSFTLPPNWIALDGGQELDDQTEWQTESHEIEIPTAGEYMMVFVWDDFNQKADPPAAIDNVSIEAVACNTPTHMAVSNVGANFANLSWIGGSEVESYTVKYRPIDLAFTEGFENGFGDWILRNGHYGYGTYVYNYQVHSGDYAFRYGSNDPGQQQLLISPALTGVTEGMRLEFYYKRCDGEGESFQVGFSSTNNADASFTFGETISVYDEEWHLYSETIPAGTRYICWKNYISGFEGSYGDVYLDDIEVLARGQWQTMQVAGNAAEVSATLTGLSLATTYEACVYPDCYPDNVSEKVRFTTEEALPLYYTDFEDGADGWTFLNNNGRYDKWWWGAAASSGGGTHSIYISNDNGVSNAYQGPANVIFATKTMDFENAGTYRFSYDWRNGCGWGDMLRVFLIPADETLYPTYDWYNISISGNYKYFFYFDRLPSGWIALDGGHTLHSSYDWQSESHDVMVPEAGAWKIVFAWLSNLYDIYDHPAAVDNVSIAPVVRPNDLHCTATTATTANLAWTENVIATNWQICLNGDESNLIDVTANPYTLAGLTYNTTYSAKVRANYGSEQSPWSNEIVFTANIGFPTDLQCTSATPESTTLCWTEHNSDIDHWQICLNGDEGHTIIAYTNPFTITGLTLDDLYTAKVRSRTDNGASEWSSAISFRIGTPLPYSTGFEEATCDWLFEETSNHDNAWAWGTATNNGGTHSLYVSNDGGTHYQYTSQQYETSSAYKYFWFEAGVYHISFDWKGFGVWSAESGQMFDYLFVDLYRDDNTSNSVYYIYLGKQGSWQTVSADVNVSTAGVYKLEFEWHVGAPLYGYSDTGIPAAIDNVSITQVGGLKPTDLLCTAANNTQATLGWMENNSNTTGWQICLNGDESNLIDVTDNPCTLTGLTTDVTYYAKVRSVTPNGATAWSDEIGFVPTIKTVLGTGTETSVALPLANHSTDAQTQQIYTAEELGAAGDILSIAFYKTGTASCSRNLDIYMAHTTRDQYTNASDWVSTSNAQLVFSGTVSFVNDDWTTITLSTPFAYNGQQSLALTVFDETTTTGETASFLCYSTAPTKQTIAMQGMDAYVVTDKSQTRMLKSSVYTDVTGYGTGSGNWQLVASPLAGETNPVDNSNMMTNTYDLYRFNPSASMEWENWKQEGDHYHFNLESGRGYLYANSANVSLVFSGTPYSSNGQVSLTKDDGARWGEWNLIGNPFATEATIGSKPFYVMNDLGTEIIAATEPTIAAMEGIFVKANEDGETVTFTTASTGGAKGGHDLGGDLVLNLSQDSSTPIDRVIIRFGEGEALPKLQIRDGSPKVYIQQDGKDYAIVNAETQTGEIPVSFKAAENDTYTLTVSTTLNSQLSTLNLQYLHLIDNMTGNDVDLLATPTYTFQAKTTDFASRFKLVFAANEEDGLSTGSGTFAFFDGSAWVIGNEGRATLQVIDILGHVLRSETIDGNATLSTSGLGAGMYVMRLVNGEEVRVQKIVVR